MEKFIELSQEEIKLGFVASCIEFVATKLNTSYMDVYNRMKKTNMLSDYIYKHYEAIHSQSREHITEDLIRYLQREEATA